MGRSHDEFVKYPRTSHLFGSKGTDDDKHMGEPEWPDLIARFPEYPGVGSVIVVDVKRISDSCDFAVPLYDYKGERSLLIDYARKKGPEGMEKYKSRKNWASIDGIAGLRSASGDGR